MITEVDKRMNFLNDNVKKVIKFVFNDNGNQIDRIPKIISYIILASSISSIYALTYEILYAIAL